MVKSRLDTYFVALLVCIYVIFSPPFIFSAYIPLPVRMILEVVPFLLLLIAIRSERNNLFVYKYMFVWSMLVLMMFLNSDSAFNSVVYSFVKLLFLVSILSVCYNSNTMFYVIRNVWFVFWFFVPSFVVVTFFVYQFDIVSFTHLSFDEISETAGYNYYTNIFFGNIIKSNILGIPTSRVCWYVFEPSMLAFFLGLNILLADSVYSHSKYVTKFKILNFCAGCLTFSLTFYVFFMFYVVMKLLSYGFLRRVSLLTIPAVLVVAVCYIYLILMDSDAGRFTSIDDRLLRLEIGWFFINNNTLLTFLFGNGLGVSAVVFDRGISSGILAIFVERGFLVFIFLVFIFYKYTKHNKALLLYILFYHFTFELVWYPALLIAIAISYAASYRKGNFLDLDHRGKE